MISRFLGGWSLLVAVLALVIDVTRTRAADSLVMTRLGDHWFQLHSASLDASQAGIQRYVHPALWDPAILAVLQTPTWLIFTLLGLTLFWIGRRRAGPDIFSN